MAQIGLNGYNLTYTTSDVYLGGEVDEGNYQVLTLHPNTKQLKVTNAYFLDTTDFRYEANGKSGYNLYDDYDPGIKEFSVYAQLTPTYHNYTYPSSPFPDTAYYNILAQSKDSTDGYSRGTASYNDTTTREYIADFNKI